jgi:hypothetical protein
MCDLACVRECFPPATNREMVFADSKFESGVSYHIARLGLSCSVPPEIESKNRNANESGATTKVSILPEREEF